MKTPIFKKTTPVGFEPTRGDPIGLAGRRLNRSAKVSLAIAGPSIGCCPCWVGWPLAAAWNGSTALQSSLVAVIWLRLGR